MPSTPSYPKKRDWLKPVWYDEMDAQGKAFYDGINSEEDGSWLDEGVTHVVMGPRKAKSQSK